MGRVINLLILIIVLVAVPVPADAQMRPVLQARLEGGKLQSGGMGYEQARRGVSLLVGRDGPGGSMRAAVTHVPEGDVEPGWKAVVLELGPGLVVDTTIVLALRVAGGGYRTDVDNRHEVIRNCRWQDGCMFEARSFEKGWAWLGGAAVEGSLTLFRRVGVVGGYRWGRLLKGANAEEWRNSWSVGLTYTFR